MAGTEGDVIQLELGMQTQSVQLRNVFYYMITDTPTETYLTGLLTEFQETVLPAYAACEPTVYSFDFLRATNLFSGDEIIDSSLSAPAGTRSVVSDQHPTFMAAAVQLTRANNRVRHGRKMIHVPWEADSAAQNLATGFRTLLTTLANTFDDNLDAGGIDLFTPVIVGRVPYTTGAGGEAYRLPVSQEELADQWSPVAGVLVPQRITTMNSRKFWRGI